MKWALACLSILLIAVPAQAHVNAVTEAPEGIVDPILGANATVTLFANCGVVIAEYDGDASGARTPLTLLLAEPPSWLNFTGDDVPFTMSDPSACDTTPDADNACPCVYTTGAIQLIPGPLAPAFETFTLQPDAVNTHGGDENVQGGAFDITVGYYATLRQLDEGHIDLADGNEYVLELELAANGATMLTIEADLPEGVTLEGLPETLVVDSPLIDGSPVRTLEIPFTINATHGHGEGMDDHGNETDGHGSGMMVPFTITPTFNGTEAAAGTPLAANVHVVPLAEEQEDDVEPLDEDSPGFPVIIGVLAMLWFARRQ